MTCRRTRPGCGGRFACRTARSAAQGIRRGIGWRWATGRWGGAAARLAVRRAGAATPWSRCMALAFAGLWAWSNASWAAFLAAAVSASIFALITVIDIEHRLILWRVVLPGALVMGLVQAVNHGLWKTLWGGLAGYLIVLVMFLLGHLFSAGLARLRGRPLDEVAFGGGDVNVATLVGLAVGWPGVLPALMATVFSAGLFSLAYLAVQVVRRRYNPYVAMPYAPFLVFGAAMVYLFGHAFGGWYLGLH